MDSMITAAAQALASGDALGALKRVALREDAQGLAIRGIAMAQLGEFVRAKDLLRRASRAFSAKEPAARARCVVAEAEVALASRELGWPVKELEAARRTLEEHGDRFNAAHARYLQVRRLVLIGHLDEAEQILTSIEPANLSPALRANCGLVIAGIAIRRLQTKAAREALVEAGRSAQQAKIPALMEEVARASEMLRMPAARLVAGGDARPLMLEDIERLQASRALIVDACRNVAREGKAEVSLVTRPVLFALVRALGEAWPAEVTREILLARGFGARFVDESHRMRLRVEVARLRKLLQPLADVRATKRGYALRPRQASEVVVLARPAEDENAAVLAFLADGELWSSSALAIALGRSQRSVQRALESLAAAGKVQSIGRARACRWVMPQVPGFMTTLLLPVSLPLH